jgi:hypothetical protein
MAQETVVLNHIIMKTWRPVQLQPLQGNDKEINNALNSWHMLSYQDMYILFHTASNQKVFTLLIK